MAVHCKCRAGGPFEVHQVVVTRRLVWVEVGRMGAQPGGVSSGCWLVSGVPDVSSVTHCAIMGEMVAALSGLAAVRAPQCPRYQTPNL